MKHRHNARFAVILAAVLSMATAAQAKDNVTTVERPLAGKNSTYVNNRAPFQQASLIKLPVGSIKPEGWIRRWLELQRDGLNGHLGEISDWLDKNDNQWLSGTGTHGWEEVPYWLRGYSNLAYVLDDEQMLAETRSWIEAVIANCREDGFMGPANTHGERHEIWAQMIMLWILQDYYEYTGDRRALDVMTGFMHWELDQPGNRFLKDYWENSRGGDNIWSAIWLYNRTGDKQLLPLIEKLHDHTADWMQRDDLPNWHCVNIAQGIREPATYYIYDGNPALIDASYNDQQLVRRLYGQVPGGMYGADENARRGYDDPRQGIETCAMVEQMASDEIMLLITGDPYWAENCEDVAFNMLPAAYTPDFRALRYITAPNHTISDSRNHHPSIDNAGPFLAMNPFSSRCCQHNHGFGWPYYAEHMVMATPDDGLAAMLYNSCSVNARVGKKGHEVTLSEATHYPFEGDVEFTLSTKGTVSFPLYLRIPSWAEGTTVEVCGQPVATAPKAGQYLRIDRTWADGDRISVHFPMNVSTRTWEANKGSISVNYGPLTLSLRIGELYVKRDSRTTAIGDSHWQAGADAEAWPSYEIYPTTPWNYALVLDGNDQPKGFEVIRRDWPADNFPFTLDAVPLEFKAVGRQVPAWGYDATGMCDVLPAPDAAKGAEEPITLVPMGAARLRVSAFPDGRK